FALMGVGVFGSKGWRALPRDVHFATPALTMGIPTAAAPVRAVDAAPAPAAVSPSADALATAAPQPPTQGRIQVSSVGRRVILDGRVAGKGPQTLTVSCGRHQVQVVGGGALQSIDVPCGGEAVVGTSK